MTSILSADDFAKPEIETIINEMDMDDVMANIHQGRQRLLNDDYQPDESETRGLVLLTRRMRSMRESGKRQKRKEPAPVEPLSSLLD